MHTQHDVCKSGTLCQPAPNWYSHAPQGTQMPYNLSSVRICLTVVLGASKSRSCSLAPTPPYPWASTPVLGWPHPGGGHKRWPLLWGGGYASSQLREEAYPPLSIPGLLLQYWAGLILAWCQIPCQLPFLKSCSLVFPLAQIPPQSQSTSLERKITTQRFLLLRPYRLSNLSRYNGSSTLNRDL